MSMPGALPGILSPGLAQKPWMQLWPGEMPPSMRILTFAGPSTDDMIGPGGRFPDEVHFNEAGLIEHAKRWNDTIELPSCMGLIPNEDPEDEPDVVEEEDGNQDDQQTPLRALMRWKMLRSLKTAMTP